MNLDSGPFCADCNLLMVYRSGDYICPSCGTFCSSETDG